MSNYQETENEVKNILDKYSRIDILVNNAGITRDSLFMRMKESQWDEFLTLISKVYLIVQKVL